MVAGSVVGGSQVAGIEPVVAALGVVDMLGVTGFPRAVLVGALMLALGGAMLWWNDAYLDRSVTAATEHPLSSVGYGIAAHLAIAFTGITLTAKLGRVDTGGVFLGWFGVVLGVGLMAVTAMLGFSVVGTILVGVAGQENRLLGIVLGATIAGTITLVEPLVAVTTWLIVVSAGIGGATRRWFNDDALPST